MPNIFQQTWSIIPSDRKNKAIWIIFLLCLGMAFEVFSVALILPFIAIILDSDATQNYSIISYFKDLVGINNDSSLAFVLTLLLVFAFVTKAIFSAFIIRSKAKFIFGVKAKVAENLYRSYLLRPYSFHLIHNSAEIIRNTFKETDRFSAEVLMPSMLLIGEFLIAFGLITLIILVDTYAALSLLAIAIISGIIFYMMVNRRLKLWGIRRQELDQELLESLNTGTGGIKEIKVLGREDFFDREFESKSQQTYVVQWKQNTILEFPRIFFELVGVISISSFLLFFLSRQGTLSDILPFMALFAAVALRLMPVAQRFLHSASLLRTGYPAVNVLYKELISSQENHQERVEVSKPFKNLTLKNISFSYPKADKSVLENIDFHLKSGEIIGLTGPSGSGKTTFVNLLLGILRPTEGCTFINDILIKENLFDWGENIGYVPQDIFLIDDSIINNICFGLDPSLIDLQKAKKAAIQANAYNFIEELEEKFNTKVGERGVSLSGGQLQRIGIARALYNNPGVLIFDEATSALDEKSEREIAKTIKSLSKERTIIIIAHRPSTIEICEKVYRVENRSLSLVK